MFSRFALRANRCFPLAVFQIRHWSLLLWGTVTVQLVVVCVPTLNGSFKLDPLTLGELVTCALVEITILVAVEVEKWMKRHGASKDEHPSSNVCTSFSYRRQARDQDRFTSLEVSTDSSPSSPSRSRYR
jgi:hypothetical protein